MSQLELTAEPLRGDVLQQGERNAEESDEQVADGQRADENIRGRLDGSLLQHYVDDQAVPGQSQDEDHRVHDHEGGLGAVRQLGDVDQRLDVVGVDELLPAQVVELEHLLQNFGGDFGGSCCHPDELKGN